MTDGKGLKGARFVLDTYVVSELMKAAPEGAVNDWYDRTGAAALAVAAPTLFELRYGVEILPAGGRRNALGDRLDEFIRLLFGDRILAYGAPEAEACAVLMAKKRALGEPLDDHLADAMIAACAAAAGLAVATRNEREFRNTGVKLVNPWRARR